MAKDKREDLPNDLRNFLESMGKKSGLEAFSTLPEPLKDFVAACAIPHCFDASIAQAIFPDMTMEIIKEHMDQIQNLSIISNVDGSFFIHDQAREKLFKTWFEEKNQTKFSELSHRLSDYFNKKYLESNIATDGMKNSDVQFQAIFHKIGFDQNLGIKNFSEEFEFQRNNGRLNKGRDLIELVKEYIGFINSDNLKIFNFVKSSLLIDQRKFVEALEILIPLETSSKDVCFFHTKVLMQLGNLHFLQNDFEKALFYYKKTLDNLSEPDEKSRSEELALTKQLTAGAFMSIARCYNAKGEVMEAQIHINKGLELAREINQGRLIAVGLETLALLHQRQNAPKHAIEALCEAEAIINELNDLPYLAKILMNLASNYSELNEFEDAQNGLEKSLNIMEQIRDQHGEAIVLNNLIRVYLRQEKVSNALECGEKAARLFKISRDPLNSAKSLRNVARVYSKINEQTKATDFFQQSLDLFEKCGEADQLQKTQEEMNLL